MYIMETYYFGKFVHYISNRLRNDKELLLKVLNSQDYFYVDVSGVIEYASERLKTRYKNKKIIGES